MKDRLLTTKEVATMIGMSKTFLDHARMDGTGPAYIKLGAAVRYRYEDVMDWLNARRVPAKHERKR